MTVESVDSNKRKKLAICGASWFTADKKHPGKSFGEKIAEKLNLELVSLARGGCGHFAIALQINEAIKMQVDYIVVGTDTWDRFELPIINSDNKSTWQKLKDNFNWRSWRQVQPEAYDITRGLANVQYYPHPDLSSDHAFLTNPTIINESLNNLTFPDANVNNFYKLTDDQREALKFFMLNLYDSNIKRQQDCWIMSDACRRLQQSQIPFAIFVDPLFSAEYLRDIEWLPSTNKITVEEWDYRSLPPFRARFHYSPEHSDAFADFVIQKLKMS